MKLTPGYYKTMIANVPYLLSFGQESAKNGISLRLNESGSLLWDALTKGANEEELLALLAEKFEAEECDLPLLQQDVSNYLKTLQSLGILQKPSADTIFFPAQNALYFRTGPLTIAYHGAPSLYETYFSDFSCDAADTTDLTITILGAPLCRSTARTVLVHTPELTICDGGDCYVFFFDSRWGIHEMQMQKDGSSARLFCVPDYAKSHAEDVFHALRFAFLVCAQNHDLVVLHSASLLYKEHAWLFSGCSGTGKSTHTSLWHEQYATPLLNGDLNMLGIKDGCPMVYGLPWCGTSEICTPKNYPLGGIVFLKQAPENQVDQPLLDQQILLLLQRLISPSWTQDLCEKNLRIAESIAKQTTIFTLACTKDPEAATVMRAAIDACHGPLFTI